MQIEPKIMKMSGPLTAGLLALSLAGASAQPSTAPPTVTPATPAQNFSTRLQALVNPPSTDQALTRFDLDFSGGQPKDLVVGIEKAMGRPVNVIVPEEYGATRLPALRMKNVTVPQLFEALGMASRKTEEIVDPSGRHMIINTSYGFRTQGMATDDSIWYFYVEKPVQGPPAPTSKNCRFYSLAPYLEGGYTVDDITTAIETSWKMLGDTSPPTIRFHKDTKLLIAVGDDSRLATIDAVLTALRVPPPKPFVPPAVAAPVNPVIPKSPEKPKSE
jgi:hypothetical protein